MSWSAVALTGALFQVDQARTHMINRRRKHFNATSYRRRYTDSHETGTTSQGAHVFTPSYAPTVLGVPIDIAADEPDRFAGGGGGEFSGGGASGSWDSGSDDSNSSGGGTE